MNARCITNKIPDLSILVADVCPDLILITETWLHSDIPDVQLSLPGYCIFRKDRKSDNDRHGGVLIAAKFNLNPRNVCTETDIEVAFINLIINGTKIKVGVAYRPPSLNATMSHNFINVIRDQMNNSDKFMIFGDFNFPGIDWRTRSHSSNIERYFLDILDELNCTQFVNEPTTEYSSLLDLCIGSSSEIVSDLQVHESFSTSDHFYCTCLIDIPKTSVSSELIIKDFRNVDWNLVRTHLSLIDWDQLFFNRTVEEMWFIFKNTINNL